MFEIAGNVEGYITMYQDRGFVPCAVTVRRISRG